MAHFTVFETALGPFGIAWTARGVKATNLPEVTPQATARRLAQRAQAELGEPPQDIKRAMAAISDLLDGKDTDLSFIVCDDAELTPLERRIHALTRAIPVGQTRTYGDIAAQLGDKQLSRVVGRAMGSNPCPVIVPCHRVMGADGKLTGFSAHGGVETKLKLLGIEKASMGLEGGLFDALPLAAKPRA